MGRLISHCQLTASQWLTASFQQLRLLIFGLESRPKEPGTKGAHARAVDVIHIRSINFQVGDVSDACRQLRLDFWRCVER